MNNPDYKRKNDRLFSQLRPISMQRDFIPTANGSVLVSYGDTKVICTATVDDKIPPWLKNSGKGWITAEYSMLPGSAKERIIREAVRGKQSGRTLEIQRLIGRCLRASVSLEMIKEKTIMIDCDVIQADGGTRTAAISGGWVALCDALYEQNQSADRNSANLLKHIASVSVGVVNSQTLLDLNYEEDSSCEVDLNIVMNEELKLIEIQGAAEKNPFAIGKLNEMITLASSGIHRIISLQKQLISDRTVKIARCNG